MPKKRVGLVLGGGGARGFAHIGVLKFLEEKKIPIDYVSGTSIGAVIGALHCLGYKATEIEDLVKATNFNFLFDLGPPRKGLIKGEKLEEFLRTLFKGKKFSDLKKPLYMVACDLKNSQKVIFNRGDLAKAARASISIPGIFMPVINKNRILVDGGVLDDLPIGILREKGLRSIIAVNLEAKKLNKKVYETAVPKKYSRKIPNVIETLLKTHTLTTSAPLKEAFKDHKNTVIISPKLDKIRIQNFSRAIETINIGYKAAKEKSPQIRQLIN
jgi:NTE family protein